MSTGTRSTPSPNDTSYCGEDYANAMHNLYVQIMEASNNYREKVNGTRGNWKNPILFKTTLCDYWIAKTHCKFGDRCWYAHGQEELRYVPRLDTIADLNSARTAMFIDPTTGTTNPELLSLWNQMKGHEQSTEAFLSYLTKKEEEQKEEEKKKEQRQQMPDISHLTWSQMSVRSMDTDQSSGFSGLELISSDYKEQVMREMVDKDKTQFGAHRVPSSVCASSCSSSSTSSCDLPSSSRSIPRRSIHSLPLTSNTQSSKSRPIYRSVHPDCGLAFGVPSDHSERVSRSRPVPSTRQEQPRHQLTYTKPPPGFPPRFVPRNQGMAGYPSQPENHCQQVQYSTRDDVTPRQFGEKMRKRYSTATPHRSQHNDAFLMSRIDREIEDRSFNDESSLMSQSFCHTTMNSSFTPRNANDWMNKSFY